MVKILFLTFCDIILFSIHSIISHKNKHMISQQERNLTGSSTSDNVHRKNNCVNVEKNLANVVTNLLTIRKRK